MPSMPEAAGVVGCVSAPEVIGYGLTFGEVMLGLMRLRPRTAHKGDLAVFLKQLVEDTRLLFGATGAAIALLDGQVCRWREKCGETGPQIRAQLYSGSGISGECLASGRVQLCQDTLTDARFDAELCRQLRIRSMIVAPIRCPAGVEGILEAWSSRPFAFDSGCTETLQRLADFSGRLAGLGRGFDERATATLIAVATQRVTAFGRDTLQRAQEFLKFVQNRIGGAPPEFSPVLVKLRTRGILPAFLLATILGAGWYGRAASVRPVPSSWNARAYLSTRVTTLVNVSTRTPIPAPGEALPRPQPVLRLAHQRSRLGASLPPGSAKKPQPLLLVSDVRPQAPVLADDASVPPFPVLGAFGGWMEDAAPLTNLFASVPFNSRSMQRVSRGIMGSQLPLSMPPIYPGKAKAHEIEDAVGLQGVVDEHGQVQETSVKTGHPSMASGASAAVKGWRSQPFLLDDSPVRMTTQINVKFKK